MPATHFLRLPKLQISPWLGLRWEHFWFWSNPTKSSFWEVKIWRQLSVFPNKKFSLSRWAPAKSTFSHSAPWPMLASPFGISKWSKLSENSKRNATKTKPLGSGPSTAATSASASGQKSRKMALQRQRTVSLSTSSPAWSFLRPRKVSKNPSRLTASKTGAGRQPKT